MGTASRGVSQHQPALSAVGAAAFQQLRQEIFRFCSTSAAAKKPPVSRAVKVIFSTGLKRKEKKNQKVQGMGHHHLRAHLQAHP